MEKVNVEFECQMKTADDIKNVNNLLKRINHLENINLDLDKKSIKFSLNPNTEKSINDIQNLIEKEAGLTTVLKGFGDTISAVSEINSDLYNIKKADYSIEKNKPIIGVLRLTQLFNNQCFVDAVIDNLNDSQAPFSVNINEFGDLSGSNFENVGKAKINLIENLPAKKSTRFNRIISNCDLNDCIGRSIVINNKNEKLAAGIIARSSPVSGNSKKICACSGKTLWQEREEIKDNKN